MWIVTSVSADLSDYTTMLEFLQKKFITEGFLAYSHRQSLIQLCFLIDEDENSIHPKTWFPSHNIREFDDDCIELDQAISLESCMLISLSSCDIVHTKNLKNTKMRLCERLGLEIDTTSAVIES